MNYYNRITIWENSQRIALLKKFCELVLTYFSNRKLVDSFISQEPIENKISAEARKNINLILPKVHSAITLCGINTELIHTPPPAIGGYPLHIDILNNIFCLHTYDISHTALIDEILRAIGIYQNDSKRAFLRTINPFYWIGLLVDYIASLPFIILSRIGIDRYKAESSFIGQIIKGCLYIVQIATAAIAIFDKLGLVERIKKIFQ